MYVHTCACADMWVLMVVAERSRAEGDSDREVHRRGKGDDWRENSSEKDKLLSSVVDDLRKKRERRERHHQTGEGKSERGVMAEREGDSITREKESVVFGIIEECFRA